MKEWTAVSCFQQWASVLITSPLLLGEWESVNIKIQIDKDFRGLPGLRANYVWISSTAFLTKKKSPDLFCFQRSRSQHLAKFSLSTLIHPHPFSSYFLLILQAASYSHWLHRVWLASPVYLVAPCTSSTLVLVSPSIIQGSASSSKLCAPERNQSCSFFFNLSSVPCMET